VPRPSPLLRLTDLAQDQWGLLTRRQIENAGIGETTLERLTAPGGALERVARGVYLLAGAPPPDHQDLKAAWLQLAPEVPAWERTADQGVISHRSAASLYGLGHLPADRHEFTLPRRRQSRRPDVSIQLARLDRGEWVNLGGLLVTRPSRIASDLLRDDEDPEAVAQIIAESIRRISDYPGIFADSLAPHSARFGFRRGEGLALLRWLLDLVGDPETPRWLGEARDQLARVGEDPRGPTGDPAS
jgi:Transcriptional regulator, AbiEi antitoxin